MPYREMHHSPLRVTDFSFRQIETMIGRCPALILPVGSLEPVGENIALGAINLCCETIADALSRRLKVAMAPLLAYGNSTPFKSFAGSAGVHGATLANMVLECCNCWLFHGFKRIMVLTLAMDGKQGIDAAVKRLNGAPGRDNKPVRFCSLQDDERFRSYCSSRVAGIEYGRSEWGIRVLTSYFQPELLVEQVAARKGPLLEASAFRQWHRRGRDPEKLRKMAPSASLAAVSGVADAGGKELFDHIISFLTEEYSPFLTVEDNASR